MSSRRDRNDKDDGRYNDDALVDDGISAAADAFKNMNKSLSNAEIGKTKKLLGIFNMDAGIVDMFDGAYNVTVDYLSLSVQPKILGIVQKHAGRIFGIKNEKLVNTLAATAAIGSTVAMKVGGYFGVIASDLSEQYKQRRELTRSISTTLDDIKGNHSLAALYLTRESDNEVIYAQRQRLSRIGSNQNLNNIMSLAVNSGTSLLFDAKGMARVWNNRATMTPENFHMLTKAPEKKVAGRGAQKALVEAENQKQAFLQTVKTGVLGVLPQMGKRITATNDYKLQKELQPYSALEMILELAQQVDSNAKASGFSLPRSFQQKHGGRREQYPLEEYLMRICIQHQKDMSGFDTKHTEIREALRDDLAAAVKPIAEAIRKGNFSAIELIHLVGEGKLIKNQGRAIATPEEVNALVHHEVSKDKADAHKTPAHDNDDAKEEKRESSVHAVKHMGKMHDEKSAKREDDVADNDNDHVTRESNRRESGNHGHAAHHS